MDIKKDIDVEVIYSKFKEKKLEYEGILFKENEFEKFLKNIVAPKIKDTEFNKELKELAIRMTGFETEKLNNVFSGYLKVTSWRIGEIVAEEILEHRYNARFHFNSERDLKNKKCNQTGADLVGFIDPMKGGTQFLFGEVKTSSENTIPPSVMYKKTGMIEQLKSLVESDEKKSTLIKWMLVKTRNSQNGIIESDFKEAMKNYIHNDRISIIGVLVRDTQPDEGDLKTRSTSLHKIITNNDISMQLLAIYTNLKMEGERWIQCI